MARVLLVLSVAVSCFVVACAKQAPPARPPVTVTTTAEVTTTVVTASTTAAPATSKAPADTKAQAACREDEDQCAEPGTNIKCRTGGCVNAGRGMTQRDIEKQRDEWLRRHPGWCAAGETGAVAPC
ncbi:hypothetical protein SAMN04489729_0594 [Amycolatopsis lurida]|uniref:Secreted protein n=1 Tax=Amycolatopsis lurida NRRL 2430 TaxID=1460371 RepID=A0A2P2FKI4_AMYLU|nr:hypothetical protein [Amycolatopsis lurida]KFU77241.1 hypothetical protein BB31_31290 [Amycolatopsis lurida NRRL 2430]SEB36335.1 hypothetical protein SAMN04489729_0594 [Amycolatopsis lurida]